MCYLLKSHKINFLKLMNFSLYTSQYINIVAIYKWHEPSNKINCYSALYYSDIVTDAVYQCSSTTTYAETQRYEGSINQHTTTQQTTQYTTTLVASGGER